jgi:hypothetical protein
VTRSRLRVDHVRGKCSFVRLPAPALIEFLSCALISQSLAHGEILGRIVIICVDWGQSWESHVSFLFGRAESWRGRQLRFCGEGAGMGASGNGLSLTDTQYFYYSDSDSRLWIFRRVLK